jgi:hypothetical protein
MDKLSLLKAADIATSPQSSLALLARAYTVALPTRKASACRAALVIKERSVSGSICPVNSGSMSATVRSTASYKPFTKRSPVSGMNTAARPLSLPLHRIRSRATTHINSHKRSFICLLFARVLRRFAARLSMLTKGTVWQGRGQKLSLARAGIGLPTFFLRKSSTPALYREVSGEIM